MNEPGKDRLQDMLSEIDEQKTVQQQAQQETAEEKRIRYMTADERREWSAVDEWHDPLAKEKPQPDQNDGKFAMASLLCGIVSVLIACIHVSSTLFGIAAIVLGVIAKKKRESADGFAKAGIILGCVCLGIALVRDILWVMGRLFPPETAAIALPGILTHR